MYAAALAAVAVLAAVVLAVVQRGHGAISKDFFTKAPTTTFLGTTGGIANSIAGTIVIVACATVIALPIGILVAVYTSEFAHGWVRRVLAFVLDVINGIPSIVIGIFVFGISSSRTSRARSPQAWRSRSSCCRSSRARPRRCSRSCPRRCARRASRWASAAGAPSSG